MLTSFLNKKFLLTNSKAKSSSLNKISFILTKFKAKNSLSYIKLYFLQIKYKMKIHFNISDFYLKFLLLLLRWLLFLLQPNKFNSCCNFKIPFLLRSNN